MNVTKRIKLDFGRAASPVVVWAKQGDEDSRFVEVVPLKNGNDYTIPSGVSIHFACKKPDGHQILNDYPTIKNNIITIPLTPQTLAAAGEGLASVILIDQQSGTVLSTQNFILYIENNPLVGAEVESSDEYQSFLTTLADVERVIEEVENIIASDDLRGKSAYQIALDNGFEGSEEEWLESLRGEDGQDGKSVTIESVLGTDADGGENIIEFSDGTEVIIRNGRKGTDGKNGKNGVSPEVILNETDDGIQIIVKTESGGSVATVYNGEDGKSAYEYAQEGGYAGTETDFAKKLAEETPKTPTIIRETNYLVMEEEGTVLSTKMTRAHIIEATKGGMELHVLSDDQVDWYVYTMVGCSASGDLVFFSICDTGTLDTITIEITEDGRMIVASIYSLNVLGDYVTHKALNAKGYAVKSSAETWTFTLSDGSTVTKKVVLA